MVLSEGLALVLRRVIDRHRLRGDRDSSGPSRSRPVDADRQPGDFVDWRRRHRDAIASLVAIKLTTRTPVVDSNQSGVEWFNESIAVLLLVSSTIVNAQSPAAWPQWRGPARDGVASSFTVPATWPAQLTKKWSATVGVGHSSPVVSGNRVVVHTRQGNREIVAAYDLESGKQLWQDGVDAPYTMNPAATGHGPGPKSTPAIADGRVFTLGISGIFSAHDLATGKLLWRKNAPPTPPEFGTASSPMVDGTSVIAFLGGTECRRTHGDGRGERRREVAVDGRRPALFVADHRDVRRHAADHHAVAEQAGRRRRRGWPPALGNADQDAVRTELRDAAGGRRSGALCRTRQPDHRASSPGGAAARGGPPRRCGATSRCRCI